MPEGYCCKCKRKRKIADAVEEVTKNGRASLSGMCSVCGAEVFLVANATPWKPAGSGDTPARSSSAASQPAHARTHA